MVSNNCDSNELILDWNEISKQIPESNSPESPLHLIKTCLSETQELDPYDQINTHLDIFLEDLKKSFNALNQVNQ